MTRLALLLEESREGAAQEPVIIEPFTHACLEL